ncbi:hypothetical protein [Halalkalibaculum sp. DA384]|uniref:hypothetical protein n=1 Tax=Halalkalibaculum sp. DA384 TaxID=3373606 RepID=UPI0037540878
MKKKLIYLFSGVLLLVLGLLAYHFYAARNAEQTIDETIREIASKSTPKLTVDFSAIEVSPFSGDIHFSNINIIQDRNIQRATSARFNLAYTDFLKFMVWGTESGLKQVEHGVLELADISYTDRETFLEVKMDSLTIDYSGNLWNLILQALTNRPAQLQHNIKAQGRQFSFHQPEEGIGSVQADSLFADAYFGKPGNETDSLQNRIELSGITWSPVPPFREKYQFFIRGFGFQPEAIPLAGASLTYQYTLEDHLFFISEMRLDSELFTLTLNGHFLLDPAQFRQSTLRDATLRIHDTSPRFQTFLQQLQQITSLKLPDNGTDLQLRLNGPLAKPDITFQP